MYRKVMVMEVKEHYALAMGEDGQIVRIRYKAGMQIGDCIYILEEDLYQEEKTEYPGHPALVPFETKKEKAKKPHPFWKQITAVAAAAALFIALFTWAMKPGTAYAMVTVDGNKNVEMTLDKKHVVKDALSRDGSITEKEAEKLVGQKVDILEEYFEEVTEPEETAVVGYALCGTSSKEEEEALQRRLERIFGTEGVIYIGGSKEDAEAAKKAGKSLGIYLAELAVSQEDLSKIINDLSEKEILELLKKQPVLMEDEKTRDAIEKSWNQYPENLPVNNSIREQEEEKEELEINEPEEPDVDDTDDAQEELLEETEPLEPEEETYEQPEYETQEEDDDDFESWEEPESQDSDETEEEDTED